MAPPKLTLFVDVISPFGYMAFHVLRTSPTFKGLDITYVPMFLGGVMQKTGNQPPINIKNKGDYINKERVRWTEQFKIPMADEMPSPFPQSTLQTGRALCAIEIKYPARLIDAFTALFKAFWIERQTIGKPEVIAAALKPVFSQAEIQDILESSAQPDVKKRLTDNTELALNEGAFGLPWFVAVNSKGEREAYWGFDRLRQVAQHLGLQAHEDGFKSLL